MRDIQTMAMAGENGVSGIKFSMCVCLCVCVGQCDLKLTQSRLDHHLA
jgi:hypothetical protein